MKKDKEKTYSSTKGVNKFILLIITIIDCFLFGGYISDYGQGNIGFSFMMSIEITVLISMILNYIIYFKKKDSELFKYVSIAGYVLVYGIAMFGAQNDLVFVMVFPITIIYMLYYNSRIICGIAVAFGIINIGDVIYIITVLKSAHSGAEINSTSILLQLACVIVYVIVLYETTRISNKNNSEKISGINEEKERNSQLLKDVLNIVSTVKHNSGEAAGYMEKLKEAADATSSALNDISAGNSNNADSITRQTVMTENIHNMIQETKKMSETMLELAGQSEEAVNAGRKSVNELKEQAEHTQQANRQIVNVVTSLIRNSKEVEEITAQIFSISNQTNLLALNASIESARAGEAGRGFAVVADEIRQLADETRKLTENIRGIIEELQSNADVANKTINDVISTSEAEYGLIQTAGDEFADIGDSMYELNANVKNVHIKIEDIIESNNSIVDSINQISAVSEEVTASTEQAVIMGEGTSQKADHAGKLMEELINTVKAVDKYM